MSDAIKKSSLLLFHELLVGIVAAMEARDQYTATHSSRVADIAEQLCLWMDLSEMEIEQIHLAAHVHDIGKIGIPDSILCKPGKLTDDEWVIMKEHPVIGYNILRQVRGFEKVAHIIRHHHERWDGSGYPDRLFEVEIPLGARIIALADSVDAMMSSRKYREAITMAQCRAEIEKNSGKMYDARIADVLLSHWNVIERMLATA